MAERTIRLSAAQQTALELLDGRIQAVERTTVEQLRMLKRRRAAILAELDLLPDVTYRQDGAMLVLDEPEQA